MTDFIQSHLVLERVGTPILHFLWQGALIAAAAAIALRLLNRRSAETRYGVAIGALLLMAVAPAATFAFHEKVAALTRAILLALASALPAANGDAAVAQSMAQRIDWNQWMAPIVVLWLSGAAFCTCRLTAAWIFTERIRRTAAVHLPDHIERLRKSADTILHALAQQIGCSRPVRLLVSERIGSPMAAGWLKPVALLPVTALTGLSEYQLRAVLAHELAHIRRHDFLVNVLQRCVESLLFYHPAVWWLSGRIRAEREHCCDDLAVRVCGDPFVYAEALMALEQVRSASPELAMASTGKGLTRRILRLLGRDSAGNDWHETILVWTFLLMVTAGALWPATTVSAQSTQPAQTKEPQVAALPKAILPQARELLLQLAGPAAQQPNDTASIEGTVVRFGTDAAIPRATVVLYVDDLSSVAPEISSTDPRFVVGYISGLVSAVRIGTDDPASVLRTKNLINSIRQSATTDENGRFTFSGIKPGRYRLSSNRNGYIRGEYGQRQPGSLGTAIVVKGGQVTKDLRLVLIPTGAITGRVNDAANEPFRNATIRAFKYVYRDGKRVLSQVQEAKSNDIGEYRLADLEPGRYLVAASFSQEPPDMKKVVLHPLEVFASPSEKTFPPVFYPNAGDPRSAAFIDIPPGGEFPGAHLTMAPIPTVRVRGRISNGTSAILNPTRVTLLPRSVDGYRAASLGSSQNSSGEFEFDRVLPGSYDLIATSEVSSRAGSPPVRTSTMTRIEVRNIDIDRLSLTLPSAFDIPGKIAIDQTGRRLSPQQMRVALEAEDSLVLSVLNVGAAVTPAEDGTFTQKNVVPGEYRFKVNLPQGAYIKSMRLDGIDVIPGSLVRIEGPREKLEIVISSDAATVDAVIRNDRQEPVGGISVVLIPDNQRDRFDLYRNGVTDAEGNVRIDGVVPGNYKAFAWENAEDGIWTDADFIRPHEARGKSLRLNGNDKITVELSPIP
jgi:beta-lactamase regulating signal transducer with metallopeptidase domain